MEFIKYPSITNHYQQKSIELLANKVPKDEVWTVSEKVHGANLQFRSERPESGLLKLGENFRIGSRNGWTDLNFYGIGQSGAFIETMYQIKEMMEGLYFNNKDTDSITVYGEVFGEDIQKGVFYCTDKRFKAFDMLVNDGFIGYKEFTKIFDTLDIPRMRTLAAGSLKECLDFNIEVDSTIPEEFLIEHEGNNRCEGVVIRPKTPIYVQEDFFAIIKKKDQGRPSERSAKPNIETLGEEDKAIYAQIDALVNTDRIISAISKIGPSLENIPFIMKEIYVDVYKDIEDIPEKDYKRVYKLFYSGTINELRELIKES